MCVCVRLLVGRAAGCAVGARGWQRNLPLLSPTAAACPAAAPTPHAATCPPPPCLPHHFPSCRSLGQFQGLLEWKAGALPVPDVLITAVGTKIWRLDTEGGTRGTATGLAWREDHQWARTLDEGWSLEGVRVWGVWGGVGGEGRWRGLGRGAGVLALAAGGAAEACCWGAAGRSNPASRLLPPPTLLPPSLPPPRRYAPASSLCWTSSATQPHGW